MSIYSSKWNAQDQSIPFFRSALRWSRIHSDLASGYCMTCEHSNAVQSSQARSFARWCPTLHPKVAFEPSRSFTYCGIKSCYDGILHPSWNQCWKPRSFEYLLVIRYASNERFQSSNAMTLLLSSSHHTLLFRILLLYTTRRRHTTLSYFASCCCTQQDVITPHSLGPHLTCKRFWKTWLCTCQAVVLYSA